jgi:ferritin-like metal-binding protein YciE
MANNATLITQLRALEHLTQTEAQIARIRVAQARTDAVRRELQRNGDNAERRARRIGEQLRAVGGVPDVVTPALGRLLAFVKSTVEQAQPLDEALLGDLTLEHQLLDRARYLKALADKAGEPDVERLADDLVTAHGATVDWLTTVLAEEALGGPAALQATPLQRVAGGVTRAVSLPTRFAVERVNRVVNTVQRTGEGAKATVSDYAGKVRQIGDATGEVVTAGRDAALQRAEHVADREGAGATAERVHEARRDLGSLKASELPIQHFEEMTGQAAIAAIRELSDPEDIQAMIAFEETHKNRSGVISAAQTRYAAIAKDSVGVR